MTTENQPPSVLITGATGFIGLALVRALVTAGHAVTVFALPSELERVPGGVQVVEGNITNPQAIATAVASMRPEWLFHLAAVGVTHPDLPSSEACAVNVMGTVNVLEAARATDTVRRIVAIGSSYEYGPRATDEGLDPFNVYSASKVAAWAFARAAHNAWRAPVVWMRPFQVYGPGQNPRALIPAAIRAALGGEDFRMTAGEQMRDFIYVEDVVRGSLAAATATHIDGRALDLGTGRLSRIRDVIEQVWQMTQAPGRIMAGALPYRAGEVTAIPAAFERTRRLTGWEARISLEQGLRLTIAEARETWQRSI